MHEKIHTLKKSSLIDEHLPLNLVFCVADDVRLAIRVLLDQSSFNPIVNELCGSLVSFCCLIHLLQLSFKNLNLFTLIFDLWSISFAISLNDILIFKLSLHFDLSSTPFTPRLKNMNTSSLGGYNEIQNKSENEKIVI